MNADHRNVLRLRTRDLTQEFMDLLGPDSGLTRKEREDVLDHLVEHAGWCQHAIEEHSDR